MNSNIGCPKCHKQIPSNSKFCMFCGSQLQESISDAQLAMMKGLQEIKLLQKKLQVVKSGDKDYLNLVMLGHCDAGKSTILGHLMYLCKSVDKSTMESMKTKSKQASKGSFMYAWLFDRTKQERDRGLTFNVNTNQLITNKYQVTTVDIPGIRRLTNISLKGISLGDVAVLTVAAPQGQFQAGISKEGQTRDQVVSAFTFGIKQLIVCINKMDSIRFNQGRYQEIKAEIGDFLKKVGYNVDNVRFIPVSGWEGDNLVERSQRIPWYKGPTLLEAIDSVVLPKRMNDKPLRIPILDVYRIGGIGTVAVGKVAYGTLKLGQTTPHLMHTKLSPNALKSIQIHHKSITQAQSGMYVGFNLAYTSKRDIKKGDVLGDARDNPPKKATQFTAQIIFLDPPSKVKVGSIPMVFCHCSSMACKFSDFISKLDRRTGKVLEENPKEFLKGDCGIVLMRPNRPFYVQPFLEFPQFGRLIIKDNNATIAVAVVKSVVKEK